MHTWLKRVVTYCGGACNTGRWLQGGRESLEAACVEVFVVPCKRAAQDPVMHGCPVKLGQLQRGCGRWTMMVGMRPARWGCCCLLLVGQRQRVCCVQQLAWSNVLTRTYKLEGLVGTSAMMPSYATPSSSLAEKEVEELEPRAASAGAATARACMECS